MSQPTSPDPLTRFFRACDPKKPLSPGDKRYVSLDEVRGENLPRQLSHSLRLANSMEPEVKVFAGHRGVGKTSELLRLKGMLEESRGPKERPFHVVFTDVLETLDPNDLDFPDLLVFLAGEVQRQLQEAKIPGFTATSELLRNVWDSLEEQLKAEVELTGASVETPFAALAVEIKNRPSARAVLRKAIERQSTNLLHAVNDLLELATVKLRVSGKEGLVLIVDGLDKLVRRQLDGGTNTHERLFIHRSEQLASLKAHVIYTVPISLVYSQEFTQLEQTFGEHHVPVSMIRLRGSDQSPPTPETAGMRKMREMVEARCRFAEVEMDEVFDSQETCNDNLRDDRRASSPPDDVSPSRGRPDRHVAHHSRCRRSGGAQLRQQLVPRDPGRLLASPP